MSNAQETARQMFQRADTEEGHIAVIAHRSRDIPALQAQGWAFTADEAGLPQSGADQSARVAELEKALEEAKTELELKALELEEADKRNEDLSAQLAATTTANDPPAAGSGKKGK